jgi:MoxR-like ATPase
MYERINKLIDHLSTELYERERPIRLGLLSALSGESLFLLGRPGTGKSLIARRLQQAFRGAKSFSYLMGRFSTPEEVFGPISIAKLRDEDRYERRTTDYLPDADVVFLDEIWKASPPIQNALLTALNERRYRNGSQEIRLPLKAFIGASNELPGEAEESAAFWDRFLVRLLLEPIEEDTQFHQMLLSESDAYREVVPEELQISTDEYAQLQNLIDSASLPQSVLQLISAVRAALAEGDEDHPPVYVSDRRWKKIGRLLRASAVLHGRDTVDPIDCAIILDCVWNTLEERGRVSAVVRDALARHAGSETRSREIAARISQVRSRIEELSHVEEESRARVPILHREEYYRLVSSEPDTDERILVWHGDVDDLSEDETAEIDLFYYDDREQLTGSERPEMTRVSEWELDVDGERLTVETEERTIVQDRVRTPTDAEQKEIRTQVSDLLKHVDTSVEELLERQKRLEDDSRQHLFVPRGDVELVASSIESTVKRLSEMRIVIREIEQTS